MRRTGVFGEPERWRLGWRRSYTRDEWLDQVPTQAGDDRLPPARLAETLAGIGAAIDAVGGAFTMSYATVVVTAVRSGASSTGG
nr:hypothetical protein [Micromonospora sp. DSM 115978]